MKACDCRLVLMLKAPRPGTVKTRLARDLGDEHTVEIYRKLVEHQINRLPPELPAEIHYTPPDAEAEMRNWLGGKYRFRAQSGGNLGERLTQAARDVFENNASGLIFLGADCPRVTAGLLRECAGHLKTHDVVLGPASDGGYYLMGIRRPEPRLFEGIDWGTGKVFEQTMLRIREAALSLFLLEELEDVDDAGSWERAKGLPGLAG